MDSQFKTSFNSKHRQKFILQETNLFTTYYSLFRTQMSIRNVGTISNVKVQKK